MSLVDLSSAMWNGYVADTENEILDSLLSRGGVMSVAELIMLLFAALTFAGIIEKIGVLDAIMEKLLSIIHNRPVLIFFNHLDHHIDRTSQLQRLCVDYSER